MTAFSSFDQQQMALAIQLARLGEYTTQPNPRVGCVIVDQQQKQVGQGWHQWAGQGHAEVNALREAGEQAKGGTAYVTLEPCSHFGRTPPCCEALVKAGIQKVIAAMEDPNPLVSGQGIEYLRKNGIEVSVGLMESEARQLNLGFIRRMAEGRPWVRCKLAASIDGRTAMASGESQWITGPSARHDVQRLRARSCAIVTGSGTALADNPSLTVRPQELDYQQYDLDGNMLATAEAIAQRQPLRVLMDRQGRVPLDAKLFTSPGSCIRIVDQEKSSISVPPEQRKNITDWPMTDLDNAETLLQILQRLSQEYQVNEVLVEAGPVLAASFLQAGLVDELWVYMAPVLLGANARPLLALNDIQHMHAKIPLQLDDIRQIGNDVRWIFKPQSR